MSSAVERPFPLGTEQIQTIRARFAEDGFAVVPPSVLYAADEMDRIEKLVDRALPRWEHGTVNPSTNDSNADARFNYEVDLKNHVHLSGVAMRHRFHRGRGSVINALDDNFLYGKRATLAERYWPAELYHAAEQPRLLPLAAELLGCPTPVFQSGSATIVFADYTGESRQYQIATPAYLRAPSSSVPGDKYLLEAILLLEDVDARSAPLRVIPGSHLRYPEINAHVAQRLGQSAVRNQIPHSRWLWEELLPSDLRPPVAITGKKGSVVLLSTTLLRASNPNSTGRPTGKSVAFTYSCRANREFLRNLPLDRAGCRRVYDGFRDKSLVRHTYLPGAQRVSRARVARIGDRVLDFFEQGWKAPIRPLYYGIRGLLKPRNKPLETKNFLNVGAGVAWRHPEVICLDHDLPNAEVALDLNHRVPLPFGDERFDGIYTSHCMEHLKESQVRWWFTEYLRTLRKGGVFRVTSPDIKGYLDAFDSRDGKYFDWIQGRAAYRFDSWLRLIVRMFAEPVVDNYTDDELYRLYESKSRAEFLEFFNEQIERITDERFLNPSCHKSWWSGKKMQAMLLDVGFSDARITTQNESACPVFAQQAYFNRTRPYMSFFTEGIK